MANKKHNCKKGNENVRNEQKYFLSYCFRTKINILYKFIYTFVYRFDIIIVNITMKGDTCELYK